MHILCVPEWASVLLLHWNGFKTWFYWVSRANPLNRMISPHKKQTFPTTKILKCCYIKMVFFFGHWVRTGSLKWSHIVCIATNFSLHTVDCSLETTIWMSPGCFFCFCGFCCSAELFKCSKKQNTKQNKNDVKLSGHTINANSSIILVKLYHIAEYDIQL